jgi:hypothetical protein
MLATCSVHLIYPGITIVRSVYASHDAVFFILLSPALGPDILLNLLF